MKKADYDMVWINEGEVAEWGLCPACAVWRLAAITERAKAEYPNAVVLMLDEASASNHIALAAEGFHCTRKIPTDWYEMLASPDCPDCEHCLRCPGCPDCPGPLPEDEAEAARIVEAARQRAERMARERAERRAERSAAYQAEQARRRAELKAKERAEWEAANARYEAEIGKVKP